MSKATDKAFAKFKRIAALRAGGATAKEIRKTSDVWVKRKPNNVKGFFNAKRAKPALATVTKGVQQ